MSSIYKAGTLNNRKTLFWFYLLIRSCVLVGNGGSEASYFPSFQLLHSVIDGYNSVTSTCLSLVGTSGRTLLSWRASWTTTGPSNTISSLVFHTTFAILRLVFLWLVISVLLRNYQRARAELYRPAVDLQDYEMVELFLRRLKMWMGLSRAKEVHFLFLTHLVQPGQKSWLGRSMHWV